MIAKRFRGFAVAACSAALALASLAPAQPAGPSRLSPPHAFPEDTPSGKAALDQLAWVLAVATGQDGAQFLPDRFAPEVVMQVKLDDLRDAVSGFSQQHGGADALGQRLVDARTAQAGLRTGDDKLWLLTLRVQEGEPYLIDILSLEDAPSPQFRGYDGWALLDLDLNQIGIASAFSAWEVLPGGEMKPLHRLRGDRRMSIGTASVLFVVGATAQYVADGHATWDDALELDPALVSIPPSGFAELPEGTAPPLAEYARAVIARRDMTAADNLLHFVGPDRALERVRSARVEAFTLLDDPAGAERAKSEVLDPFLSVHDLYRIKCTVDGFLVKEYAEASPEEKRRLLAERVAGSIAEPQFVFAWRRPQELLKVGWLVSPDDLCIELGRLWTMSRRDGMQGLAYALAPAEEESFDLRVWRSVTAVRGGEPGSITVAWVAERVDGRVFVVSIAVNDEWKPVATRKPQRILLGVVGLLGRL